MNIPTQFTEILLFISRTGALKYDTCKIASCKEWLSKTDKSLMDRFAEIIFNKLWSSSHEFSVYFYISIYSFLLLFFLFIYWSLPRGASKKINNCRTVIQTCFSLDIYHCARETITLNADTHIFFVFFLLSFFFALAYLASLMGYYTFWSECNELTEYIGVCCVCTTADKHIAITKATTEQIERESSREGETKNKEWSINKT